MHEHIHTHTHVDIHMHKCTHTCTHTYTHTQRREDFQCECAHTQTNITRPFTLKLITFYNNEQTLTPNYLYLKQKTDLSHGLNWRTQRGEESTARVDPAITERNQSHTSSNLMNVLEDSSSDVGFSFSPHLINWISLLRSLE